MERRAFLRTGGLLGLAAAPAALATAISPLAADPPVPRADVFGRRDAPRFTLPTPEEAVHRWYTQDVDIAHTFDLQIAFHQLAEAEMKRLPPAMELPEPYVRRALAGDPSCRVQRTMTPRFTLDLYDNGQRPMPESHVCSVPTASLPLNVYIGGHGVPHRILTAARQGVKDLVDVLVRDNPRAAFTCPRAVVDLHVRGFMLEFYFYSQRIYHVPPPDQMPGGRPHTAVYEGEIR